MRHFQDEWIQEWCENNGWTELFRERYNFYWAFPPGAVMPEPIPQKALRVIKREKGLCAEEKIWFTIGTVATITAAVLAYFLASPMPVVLAFAFDAILVAQLEVEEI